MRQISKYPITAWILAILFFQFSCVAQKPTTLELDQFPKKGELTRLVIFYPSTGTLNALQNLNERDLFPLDDMEVIGVFHEKEVTDYRQAMQMARDKKMTWIHFFAIKSELNAENLFQENQCTPIFKRIFKESDGIIFFGGADIPPYLYGAETNLLTRIRTPYRHFVELSFLFHLLGGKQNPDFKPFLSDHPDYPILGICLGSQSINVATGGTMIQDIWNQRYGKSTYEQVLALDKNQWHTNPWSRIYPEKDLIPYNMHPINLLESGKFVKLFGFSADDHPFVTSAHHQMYLEPGLHIRFIATSLDGKVPEALEHELYPNVLGVQFHPEFSILWDPNRTFCFTPQDSMRISLPQILNENPPSYEFNRKIWAWFGEKLHGYHREHE